jgi:hypothetical protein
MALVAIFRQYGALGYWISVCLIGEPMGMHFETRSLLGPLQSSWREVV